MLRGSYLKIMYHGVNNNEKIKIVVENSKLDFSYVQKLYLTVANLFFKISKLFILTFRVPYSQWKSNR